MAPPPPPSPSSQRSPGGASSSSYSGAPYHHYANAPPLSPPAAEGNSLPPLRHPPFAHMDDQRGAPPPPRRERWWQSNAPPPPNPSSGAAHRSDVMNMNSILGGGAAIQDDPRAPPIRYDRERERDRDRDREREWEWERERERERTRASHYPGPPVRQPPPSPGSRQEGQRSPVASFNAATSPGRRSDADEAAYHRDREWERERERELDRERELRWRASQRSGGAASEMGSSSQARRPSGDVRYTMGGPEPPRSPQESYPPSMPPRKSPIPGHPAYASTGRGTPSGAPPRTHARQPSGEMPLPPLGRESPPRHAAYASHYDDPRAPSGHGGMPPPHRSPERMRPPLPHGAYDSLSEREREREYEREMRMLERDRDMMAPTDRYGRRIHPSEGGAGHLMMDEGQMYDRYGPRGPPSGGPPGPPSSGRSVSRGYDDRGPPPLPYPPTSPTQSREHDRIRKDQGPPPPMTGGPRDREQPDYHSRESSAPSLPRHRDERGPPPPPHYDSERPLRSGPPPLAAGPSTKLEPGVVAPVVRRPTTLSPTTERGVPFRDAPPPPHRGPSMPPFAPTDRDPRERDLPPGPPHDHRDLEFAQHEHLQHLEREQRAQQQQQQQQQQQLERERREHELELERERSFQEKEASREKKERRREKQLAEKNAAVERERQAQAQAQAQAAPPAAGHLPPEQGEMMHGRAPPAASLEEALIITAQQHAAAYGRAPTLADFQQAAAAVGYPPGMPLPPGILPSAFMPPSSLDAQPQQPHVIRDPNAGPRVDSEPVWLYLELCERDEAIRRAQRLPLDILAEEQKAEVEAELQGLPIPAPVEAEKAPETGKANAEADPAPVAEVPLDPLPRHLIGMDKGRPVRHLGSWIYDSTVDPLFPAELLARNVGATLEVRIPGTLLSSSSRRAGAGPVWQDYLRMQAECMARCQVGEDLKNYMDGDSCTLALNGHPAANSWKLGWRGKEHARMSLEMRIEERMAETQLFSEALPQKPAPEESKKPADAVDEKDAKPNADEEMPATTESGKAVEDKPEAAPSDPPTEVSSTSVDKRGDGSAWDFWLMNPLLRRKLWGTDVYTDDSDVLAMCVHAGWVEGPSLEAEGVPAWVPPGRAARAWTKLSTVAPSAASTGSAPALPASAMRSSDLSVVLRIAPKLIAYKGCQRGGLQSRSWGNTHDGVSLVVESVELKPPGYAHGKGRSSAKRRIDQLAWAAGATTLVSPAAKRVASTSETEQQQEPPRYFWDMAVRA